MSTMPGIIIDTLSRQKKAVQGYDEPPPPLQVRPKHVPGGYVLQHMVICAARDTTIAILYRARLLDAITFADADGTNR